MKSVALLDCPSILKGGVLGGCISILWASAPGCQRDLQDVRGGDNHILSTKTITMPENRTSVIKVTKSQGKSGTFCNIFRDALSEMGPENYRKESLMAEQRK